MSTQSSIISGIAGAVIASAGWYFTTKTASAESNPSVEAKNSEMISAATLQDEETCTIRKDHAITWSVAQTMVGAYQNNQNTPHLNSNGNGTLNGWFLDRCIIEDLFRLYPESDGLQLYIGLKNPEGQPAYNDLVWMASQLVKVGNDFQRQNCKSIENTVIDLSKGCPTMCPTINPLPN